MAKQHETRRESLETRRLVETGFELAESLEITSLLVQADELRDVRLIEKLRGSQRVIWLSRATDLAITRRSRDVVVSVPETTLTVTVFHKGRTILELEKPVPQPQQAKPGRKKPAGR